MLAVDKAEKERLLAVDMAEKERLLKASTEASKRREADEKEHAARRKPLKFGDNCGVDPNGEELCIGDRVMLNGFVHHSSFNGLMGLITGETLKGRLDVRLLHPHDGWHLGEVMRHCVFSE